MITSNNAVMLKKYVLQLVGQPRFLNLNWGCGRHCIVILRNRLFQKRNPPHKKASCSDKSYLRMFQDLRQTVAIETANSFYTADPSACKQNIGIKCCFKNICVAERRKDPNPPASSAVLVVVVVAVPTVVKVDLIIIMVLVVIVI